VIDLFLLAKWLHILSATVLFGTGIGTAFQMVWVMRRGDPGQVAGVAGAWWWPTGFSRRQRGWCSPQRACGWSGSPGIPCPSRGLS
jgi:nitrate/nitrite transporter NarK